MLAISGALHPNFSKTDTFVSLFTLYRNLLWQVNVYYTTVDIAEHCHPVLSPNCPRIVTNQLYICRSLSRISRRSFVTSTCWRHCRRGGSTLATRPSNSSRFAQEALSAVYTSGGSALLGRLWFIDLTVATCHIQYTFLSLCQFVSRENGQNTTILEVRHFRMIRKCRDGY